MNFDDYSRSFLHFYTEEVPVLLKKVLPKKEACVADLGAGDGALLVALKRGGYLEGARKIFAVDLSPERCERLAQCSDVTVYCSDVTEIKGIKDGEADLVICTQVIEHVDEGKLLSEISRVLKKDGVLYIASLVKKKYGWWYYRTADGKWALDPTHLREYASREEFEKRIGSGGFKVEETVVTPLRLSIPEFIIRRVFAPLFPKINFNSFFLEYAALDWLRKRVYLHPPRYFIIEVLAKKN
jgi:SAM-dependent methyltransferase